MNKLLTNPILVVVLGLTLGVGTGMAWFWKMSLPLLRAAREARSKQVKAVRPEAPWDFWTVEIENLSNELKEGKASLQKREEELALRETRFAAERQELNKQREQLEALRADISSRMIEIQADEIKNLKTLAAAYSNVTPRATITIFKEMDDNTVVKLLALMKTDVVSPILEEMSKEAVADPKLARRAAQLSEKLRLFRASKQPGTP